ncbi:MAG: hypothetical protein NTW48_01050 [Chloroflexi bacterium]|nr:hypothetical protein [Chloroflexota bacterium]
MKRERGNEALLPKPHRDCHGCSLASLGTPRNDIEGQVFIVGRLEQMLCPTPLRKRTDLKVYPSKMVTSYRFEIGKVAKI